MARTKKQIKTEITTEFMGNENLAIKYGFAVGSSFDAEFSLVSLENILFEIVALAIFIHEQFFNQHSKEIDERLANEKSGTLPWYRTMALAFQYGFDLLPDSDKFNNLSATAEQIEASKIVKYAAVVEGSKDSRVIIKIAGETNGVLAPITNVQRDTFDSYIDEVRYAGVKVTVINYLPDRLYLTLQIYIDPLLIDASGNSILNGGKPVETAIKEYMKELPFNGEFVLAHLVDKLQMVEGVRIPHIMEVKSSWIDPAIGGYGTPQPVNVKSLPESGYYEVVNFDNITYVV